MSGEVRFGGARRVSCGGLDTIVDRFEEQIALAYPSPELFRFHNFVEHIATVQRDGKAIMDRCREAGILVDELVVRAAIAGHDAGIAFAPSLFRVSSSEKVAALISADQLAALGAPRDFIERVRSAIEDTEGDSSPRSIEGKVVRAADLACAAGEYSRFIENTWRLHDEARRCGASEITFSHYLVPAFSHLGRFLRDQIHLTPFATDEEGRSRWHLGVLKNIVQAVREHVVHSEIIVCLEDPSSSLFSARGSLPERVRVLIVPAESWQEASGGAGERDLVLPAPMAHGCISVPSGVADRVYAPVLTWESAREAQRVLMTEPSCHHPEELPEIPTTRVEARATAVTRAISEEGALVVTFSDGATVRTWWKPLFGFGRSGDLLDGAEPPLTQYQVVALRRFFPDDTIPDAS